MLIFAQFSPRKNSVIPGPRLDVDTEGINVSRIGPGPIPRSITEDTKTIYEMVSKGAGLDLYFHPEVNSRRIQVDQQPLTCPKANRRKVSVVTVLVKYRCCETAGYNQSLRIWHGKLMDFVAGERAQTRRHVLWPEEMVKA
jgi:hypothetical protein